MSPAENDKAAVPRIVLTPPQGEPAIEIWRSLSSPFADISITSPPEEFRYQAEYVNVDGLIFSLTRFDPCQIVAHNKAWRAGEDTLALILQLTGVSQGKACNEPIVCRPHHIVLQDWAHPYDMLHVGHTEQLGVLVPRGRVPSAELLYNHVPSVSWPINGGAGRLLSAALLHVWNSLGKMTLSEAPAVAQGFLGLLEGFIAAELETLPRRPRDAALFQAMRLFIEQRLASEEITAERVANEFDCSRSTVYRLFEPYEGVQSYVRNRRYWPATVWAS